MTAMRHVLVIVAVVASSVLLAGCHGVQCNQFDLLVALVGDVMTIQIASDLPDDTTVLVVATRKYTSATLGYFDSVEYETWKRDEAKVSYIGEKGALRDWRKPRTVVLDNRWFHREIAKQRKIRQGFEAPFKVLHVDQTIWVSAVVPVGQSNPAFGKMNKRLTGSAVVNEGHRRFARSMVPVEYPL